MYQFDLSDFLGGFSKVEEEHQQVKCNYDTKNGFIKYLLKCHSNVA